MRAAVPVRLVTTTRTGADVQCSAGTLDVGQLAMSRRQSELVACSSADDTEGEGFRERVNAKGTRSPLVQLSVLPVIWSAARCAMHVCMQPCMQRGYGLTLAQHQGGQWEAGCGRCSGHKQVSSHLAPCPWAATANPQAGQAETCRLQVQRTWCAVWRVGWVDCRWRRKGDEKLGPYNLN